MSMPANLTFSISAKYLGPIFCLQGHLTKNPQNLVFARNGTGKSFLTRAFWYLDLHGQGKLPSNVPCNLVSDEDDEGEFFFKRGNDVMGSLELKKSNNQSTPVLRNTIFHVFSEEFVQEELREREYKLGGEIENQIAVGSTNIQIKSAKDELNKAKNKVQNDWEALKRHFDNDKNSELIDKAGIRKQLTEYKKLSFEDLLTRHQNKPDSPEKSFGDILKDLGSLGSIPAKPVCPEHVDAIGLDKIDLKAIMDSLEKVTSPASVSQKIKEKIDAHWNFFKTGIDIIDQDHISTCPFCEQAITTPDIKSVIDAYVKYFTDEEAKHKQDLQGFCTGLKDTECQLRKAKENLVTQKSLFNALRTYLPSMKETSLVECEDEINTAVKAIASLKSKIENKAHNLGVPAPHPGNDIATLIRKIDRIISKNNKSVDKLKVAVSDPKLGEERKDLQRQACDVFEKEFTISRWCDIKKLRASQQNERDKSKEIENLEQSNPSTDARLRVAETFDVLLKRFFGEEKYVFDKDTFVLKRGAHEMSRGLHRTLSEGEKTAIAFCYFVACVHCKVKSDSDYGRLFLVFDDPVTSMSYDFVFTIAQTLKNLKISQQGNVSINPSVGEDYKRPELLILTHSSYFFNILVTNHVFNRESAFALNSERDKHKLTRLNRYVAPFQEQLKDIYEIANRRDPDHSTANTIRSVLEAVGRFCWPDKSDSLANFIKHLAAEDVIEVKSILINSLSHGSYYEETPSPDDLKLACEETLSVVEKYAPGQIKMIQECRR